MDKVFETIKIAFQSLWQIKDYGKTLQIVTPVATINNMFVSVFITKRGEYYIATDGGWIDSGLYECEIDWKSHIFRRIGLYYIENLDIQKQEAKGRTFYYKRINKLELLPNIVFDMANFINAVVSSSTIRFTADREEITFKKNVRGFFRRELCERNFEYDKPLSDESPIRFGAIEKSHTGLSLFNFVSGSNSTYFANALCRSNMQFQMIRPLRRQYHVRKTITVLDDSKDSVMNSPQVQNIYNFLLDNQTIEDEVYKWSQKDALMSMIREDK